MKIALYHDLPPGGALRYLLETTRRSAADHEYTLVADRDEQVQHGDLAHVVHRVIAVRSDREFGSRARIRPLLALARRQARVAETIDGGDFDLAVVHPSQITQAPHLLAAITATPSVYIAQEARRRSYERGYQPWVESGGPWVRTARSMARAPIERWLRVWDAEATAGATALVANSAFSAETIARAYGRTPSVVYPGVDVDEFPPGLGSRSGVISVGAMDPTKGHDLVVEAVGLVPSAIRPAVTIVYERCDTGFAEQLARRAADLRVELVLRQGVDATELAAAYASAAVTVVAARLEPFGLTVLESIAAGTPVVAVSEGGFRETVQPGRTGELVPRDQRALAGAIERVIGAPEAWHPCALRESLTPGWTWDRTVHGLHRVYEVTRSPSR